MPSDAWTGSGSNMRENRITMIDFLDMIKSFFLTGFTGLTGCFFLGADFTDYAVFVVAIGIQVSEFLLRTIHLTVEGILTDNVNTIDPV